MTITTYAELQSEVASFLNRSDLTATIPTFIQMAEARMNRTLRHWRMETSTTFTATTQFTALPADWIETVRMRADGGNRLELIPHAKMEERRERSLDTAGEPNAYAFVAGQIELHPTPNASQVVKHVYYSKIPALSDSNTTNWLLDEAPDAYLYGALLHSAPYLVEDQRLGVWDAMYSAAIVGVQSASDRARHSGTGLRMVAR